MDLTARALERRDIPPCVALLEGRLAYPTQVLADVARAWRRQLRDDALIASVIEMRAAGGAPAVVGFGASVFVT